MFKGGFPLYGHYLPDKNNSNNRIMFKYRQLSDGGVAYSQSISGLNDVGRGMTIVTGRRFDYKNGDRVIIQDIVYNVTSIVPFIPDNVNQGFVKGKINTLYQITLG